MPWKIPTESFSARMEATVAWNSSRNLTMIDYSLLWNLSLGVLQKMSWTGESSAFACINGTISSTLNQIFYCRFNGSEVFNDRISVTWFKDLRRARQKRGYLSNSFFMWTPICIDDLFRFKFHAVLHKSCSIAHCVYVLLHTLQPLIERSCRKLAYIELL